MSHTLTGYAAQDNPERSPVSESITYTVPAIHCEHCALSIREEVSEVAGVESVDVDLETKVVSITGRRLDDDALRAAIVEAGYEAA
jgi:copper chaperone CopZ